MNTYFTFLKIYTALATRNKTVLMFNYLLPLLFFTVFSGILGKAANGIANTVAMSLVVGVIGNGLYGAGLQIVAERESNVLRRLKTTPLSPLPIVTACLLSGLILYLPVVILIHLAARVIYGLPNWCC
jgi:hypothetical protein